MAPIDFNVNFAAQVPAAIAEVFSKVKEQKEEESIMSNDTKTTIGPKLEELDTDALFDSAFDYQKGKVVSSVKDNLTKITTDEVEYQDGTKSKIEYYPTVGLFTADCAKNKNDYFKENGLEPTCKSDVEKQGKLAESTKDNETKITTDKYLNDDGSYVLVNQKKTFFFFNKTTSIDEYDKDGNLIKSTNEDGVFNYNKDGSLKSLAITKAKSVSDGGEAYKTEGHCFIREYADDGSYVDKKVNYTNNYLTSVETFEPEK